MRHLRFEHVVLSSLLLFTPLFLTACGGKEEPKVKVSAPEVVETSKSAAPAVTPAPTPEKVEAPEVPAEVIEEATKPEEALAEAVEKTEEMAAEENTAPADAANSEEVAPVEPLTEELSTEITKTNQESYDFFPKLDMGKTVESVIDEFAAGNYENLILIYAGKNEEVMAKHKGNIHLAFCNCEGAEGIIIMSPTNSKDYNGIIIMAKEGFVDSFVIGNNTGLKNIPHEFPPVSVNWTEKIDMKEIPADILALYQSIQACGYEL